MKILGLLIIIISSLNAIAYSSKEKGLLWGSVYGDAFGGPYEFQEVINPHPLTQTYKRLSSQEWQELAKSVKLVDYNISASSYGPWIDYAPKGTITDDTRHKIIFWNAFLNSSNKNLKLKLADSYVSFYYKNQNYKNWLEEYYKAAIFINNPRHIDALPTSRLWGGIATQAGQMIYLPMAIIFSRLPARAYKETYISNIFDNGIALDYTSSLVAALSYALKHNATFEESLSIIHKIDPFRYSDVPYVKRHVTESIARAREFVNRSKGSPKRLFDILERDMVPNTWWEADVAFIVPISFMLIAKTNPLASLALVKDFGHDSDSYAQTIGAFLGALYGEKIFNQNELKIIKKHIQENYGEIWKKFE